MVTQCCSQGIRLPAGNLIEAAQRRHKVPYVVGESSHCALPSDYRSKIQTLFQPMNFAGSRHLATTLVTFILFTFGFTLFNSASSTQVLKLLWLKNAVLHQQQTQYIINI